MEIRLSPQEQKEFTHISFAARNKDVKGNFPDFLIVGPQRTGTTWLSANLRFHPELCMSIPKEIYYFSRLVRGEERFFHHLENFKRRLRNIGQYGLYNTFREFLRIIYFDFLVTGTYKANQLEWYMKFFKINSFIYRKHAARMKKLTGKPYNPKRMGESTASYAVLDEEIIDEIVRLNPNIKVILMIRNPIDRAWSHAVKDLARNFGKKSSDVEPDAYIDFLKEPYTQSCGYYTEQIKQWKKYLKPENFLVGKYTDISVRPVEFLKEVFTFLDIDVDEKHIGEQAKRVINPTTKGHIPPKVKEYLVESFYDEMKRLDEQYNSNFLETI